MKNYLQAHGFDVWREIVYGYKELNTPPIDKDGNKIEDNDSSAKNVILNGFIESI
jgi:hypothetical protein